MPAPYSASRPHGNRPPPSDVLIATGPIEDGVTYQAREVSKHFSGVKVLDRVSVEFLPGEIHALIGENGAGKSTLLKILAGIYQLDGGALKLDGQVQPALSPREAQRRGVYLVPQEPRLMPDLSVAENLFLGTLPRRRMPFAVDWSQMRERTAGLLAAVGLSLEPRTLAGQLSLAQQQLVECARALAHGCRVVFFDEPTSPLTSHEADMLFALMDQLRRGGLTLGFISHRLDEVERIADRLTVLRDGRVVAREPRGAASREQIVNAMVGREIKVTSRRTHLAQATTDAPLLLEVEDLHAPPAVQSMSLHVRAGEIVGLAGLVGSGRTEFAETVFGLRAPTAGVVRLAGRDIAGWPPRACIDAGLVYLAEDRGRNGIFSDVDLTRNVTSAIIPRIPRSTRTLLRLRKEQLFAQQVSARMSVRASSMANTIKTLSGGNQQKALFARWVAASPRVAIFDEPTRGVDVGAKESIYEIIENLAANGLATLVISSELEEIVRLCDRVYAIYEGRVIGDLAGDAVTAEALGPLVVGAR
jgi:ABC-type sugar transport system ATPase subunit